MDGWIWDIREQGWEVKFKMLLAFVAEFGHARVPNKFAENKSLGVWVGTQRSRRGAMSEERRLRLEALPGWTWDASDQSASAISKTGVVEKNQVSNN